MNNAKLLSRYFASDEIGVLLAGAGAAIGGDVDGR